MKRFILAMTGLAALSLLWSLVAAQQTPPAQPAQKAEPPQQTQTTPAPQPTPPPKPAEQGPATFIAESKEVILPVTVTDDRGYFVSNLTVEDFRVLDEGRPQRITFFNHNEKQPIVIGFLVDLSSYSAIHWKDYKDEIQLLIWELVSGEREKNRQGYLITYGNEANLAVNTTWDGQAMADKVEKMKPGGGAALYDAIYMACTSRDLVKGEPYEPRRVIVIIGDGHNNTGSKSQAEVLELAKRKMVTIYGISTVAFGFASTEPGVLEKLAFETGGMVEYPLSNLYRDVSGYLSTPRDAGNYVFEPGTGAYTSEKLKGIVNAVTHLQGELTTQYVLRFVPDIDAGDQGRIFRRVKVELPSLSNARIKTRDGYYPNGLPGSDFGLRPGTPAGPEQKEQKPPEVK